MYLSNRKSILNRGRVMIYKFWTNQITFKNNSKAQSWILNKSKSFKNLLLINMIFPAISLWIRVLTTLLKSNRQRNQTFKFKNLKPILTKIKYKVKFKVLGKINRFFLKNKALYRKL
jgi:hypothetical protein